MKNFKVCAFLIIFFYSSFVFADELTLSLDKNVLSEGDTLSLSIEYSGTDDGRPDLSSLQNDFQIVSNSSSTQVNFINGNFSQTKKWTVGLRPLKKGKITIKPIMFAGLTSNYAEVEVKELTDVAYIPDSKNNFNSPYFKIEQEFDGKDVYLHQQVNMWVTIYDSLGLKDGTININEDAEKNWIIKKLTDTPLVKQDVINGKKMNVVKFLFAMFPQKSGELKVPQFSFNGYYVKDANFGFDSFQDDFMMFGIDFRNAFGQKVPVIMKTKEKTLKVLPNIDGISLRDWLPLKGLEISSNLSVKNGFKVGEAFSQHIEIKAIGIEKNLFPNIEIPEVAGIRQYPEKPEYREEIVDGNIVTTASYNIVYIPSKGGEFVIPEIKVNWFNVEEQKMSVSSVKKEKIIVYSNSEVNQTFETNEEIKTDVKNIEKEENLTEKKVETTLKKNDVLENFLNKKNVILGFVFLIFLCILMFKKRNNSSNAKQFSKKVITAIEKHDYRLAKVNIIDWAKVKFNDDNIKNFKDISFYAKNPLFEKQLDFLNKMLYSGSEELFDRVNFIKVFKEIDKKKVKNDKKQNILPNLYD